MYLDNWISKKIGMAQTGIELHPSRRQLEDHQLQKLRETLAHAVQNSPFYGATLGRYCVNGPLPSLKALEELPFTTEKDLKENALQMLCVNLGEISRIVTLNTSGTTGASKRIYFTEEDQELTMDYFHHGIRCMLGESDKVLILLSHDRPGSVGELLRVALERMGACGTFDQEDPEITSVVGLPGTVAALASGKCAFVPRSVLLTSEYVSPESIAAVKTYWGSKVFEHYGMTEMGLGCAMSCRDTLEDPPVGYHVRETDLYIEIIDPKTGEVVPDGQFGEIVFTTLTRKGMPFIRHRTGDISRWLTKPCTCSSILKRLDRVGPRRPLSKTEVTL